MAREQGRGRPSAPPQIAIERELFLRTMSVARAQSSASQQLAHAMSDVSFRAGETMYRVGDFTRIIHFVTHGELELTAPNGDTWRLKAPAVIGILDVNQRRPFSRTATALTDVRALALREDDWVEALEEHFEFARASMLTVAGDAHRLHLDLSPGGGFPEAPPSNDDEPHALNLQERTLALRAVPCFAIAAVQALAMMAVGAFERALSRGERLFALGDRAASIFVVAHGTIHIEREDPTIRARFGPGSIVGGGAALSFVTQPYTAEAETPAVVLEIRREDLVDVIEDQVDMIRAIFAGLGSEREYIMNEIARRAKIAKAALR
jgi:CRP-like cAMP-binding protein